jgi:hypothetical protein
VIELILSLQALADTLCQTGVSGGQNVEFLLFFDELSCWTTFYCQNLNKKSIVHVTRALM